MTVKYPCFEVFVAPLIGGKQTDRWGDSREQLEPFLVVKGGGLTAFSVSYGQGLRKDPANWLACPFFCLRFNNTVKPSDRAGLFQIFRANAHTVTGYFGSFGKFFCQPVRAHLSKFALTAFLLPQLAV